jgi:hypothetical protein
VPLLASSSNSASLATRPKSAAVKITAEPKRFKRWHPALPQQVDLFVLVSISTFAAQ